MRFCKAAPSQIDKHRVQHKGQSPPSWASPPCYGSPSHSGCSDVRGDIAPSFPRFHWPWRTQALPHTRQGTRSLSIPISTNVKVQSVRESSSGLVPAAWLCLQHSRHHPECVSPSGIFLYGPYSITIDAFIRHGTGYQARLQIKALLAQHLTLALHWAKQPLVE